jgi:hypothetical protein
MNILNIILMDFTLSILPSTACLPQQGKTSLAVNGYDGVNEENFFISNNTGTAL